VRVCELFNRNIGVLVKFEELHFHLAIVEGVKVVIDSPNVEVTSVKVRSNQDVSVYILDEIMAHFPVARIVNGGPSGRLPISLELPIDRPHVVNRAYRPASSLFLKRGLHASTLLDLSDPNVVRKGFLRSIIFRHQVVLP